MKITFLPKSPIGKRAVYLTIIFVVLSIAGSVISDMIDNTIEYPNPFNSPLLGTTIYLTFIVAIIAFITGLRAIFKSKEHALLLYIVALISGYFSIIGSMLFIAGLLQSIGFWHN